MIWDNLADEKCPRCGCTLEPSGMLDSHRLCSDSHCLFKINMEKFEEIVSKTKERNIDNFNPDENLSDLNNLEL